MLNSTVGVRCLHRRLDDEQLQTVVAGTLWPDFRDLVCGEDGHAPGHVRLPVAGRADLGNLVETFGDGMFDGFHCVFMLDELVKNAELAAGLGQASWEPHPPFPAPGGLVPWMGNEHEQSFQWITQTSTRKRSAPVPSGSTRVGFAPVRRPGRGWCPGRRSSRQAPIRGRSEKILLPFLAISTSS
ncbi:hypothetical protein ACF08B_30255 [Streptomyces sp. NPDC015139]|uniref:hypothetical protein n=1 Tax=Streptomyces sp. NPDC015139 TaxID=3364942 RepID=UPI003701B4B3